MAESLEVAVTVVATAVTETEVATWVAETPIIWYKGKDKLRELAAHFNCASGAE
jgi:hypothetical protein